jgi:uncharacterized protein YndB with AHSA1/START domain
MKTVGYAHRVDIAALPGQVWTSLTEQKTLGLWMGTDARIKPRQGGNFYVSLAPGLVREGLIDVFDAPRRLRLIYLTPPELPAFDGAVVDDFLLESQGAHTIVRLLASGIPDTTVWNPHYSRLRSAWERALGRLKVLTEQQARALKSGDRT